MNNIKSAFTINDMENISGIKAHTIRIWEKRYNAFSPKRMSREVRIYELGDLQKLLNITYLLDRRYKISHVAGLPDSTLDEIVKSLQLEPLEQNTMQQLKLAMFSFDADLFETVYKTHMKNGNFSHVFENVFVPFLRFIGLQWQTKSVTIAHEHFISNLIFQKIQSNIEALSNQKKASKVNDVRYVLFLHQEEMHELGLLYMNYELIKRGENTIYLGSAIPLVDMEMLKGMYSNISFVTALTVFPKDKDLQKFISACDAFIKNSNHVMNIFGYHLLDKPVDNTNPNVKLFDKPIDMITSI